MQGFSSQATTSQDSREDGVRPTGGAILSINATKWVTGIIFDELREIMSETIKPGPGVHILETETTSISEIPVYRIVQSHENGH